MQRILRIHLGTGKEALFCREKGGLELLGFVVHSLIHYVAFEKALSHSAV